MADGDKPKLDTADLKARLGLKARRKPAPAPRPKQVVTPPAAAGGGASGARDGGAGEAAAAKPTEASVQAAREAAAKASAEAGPAIEDFSVAGVENTPVPKALPGGAPRVEYVTVGAAAGYPGGDKKRRNMLIALAVVVGVLAFFLGQLLSGASLQNELRDSYILEAKEKQELFKNKAQVFERITALRSKVKFAIGEVDAVRKGGEKDMLVLEKTFEELVPVMAAYVKDEIVISPADVMGATMYNGELMRQVVAYAVKTEVVFQKVQSALGEMGAYIGSAAPPATTTRVVHLATEEREVEGLGKIPTGKGLWIKDTGAPAQVDLVDERGRPIGKEWQQMVLPEGETEAIQVPTKTVMSLDLSAIYDANFKRARRTMVARMANVVEELDVLMRGLDEKKLMEAVQEWARK